MKHVNRTITVLVFIFLYIPMIALAVASFNEGLDIATFKGFTFRQYANLFRDETLLTLLRNSLIIAILSSLLATFFGTMAAVGIHSMKGQMRKAVMTLTNIPMTNPDIVTGVSMMLLFVALGGAIKFLNPGRVAMLIAHVTFSLPYVILSILPRFKQFDPSLTEAALDLGCTPAQSFFKVELPAIIPGIISGFVMGFTLSLDDFVISHFVSSPDFKTLPLYIYNQTAHNVKFSMYALCTLIIVTIFCLLLAVNLLGNAGERKKKKEVMGK